MKLINCHHLLQWRFALYLYLKNENRLWHRQSVSLKCWEIVRIFLLIQVPCKMVCCPYAKHYMQSIGVQILMFSKLSFKLKNPLNFLDFPVCGYNTQSSQRILFFRVCVFCHSSVMPRITTTTFSWLTLAITSRTASRSAPLLQKLSLSYVLIFLLA